MDERPKRPTCVLACRIRRYRKVNHLMDICQALRRRKAARCYVLLQKRRGVL
ncbi:hypothetical protein CGRA01v4_06858 [Colletotrichum graminicola]|nr:hypothetical protein CGRA01v4_06858 [Colletotrichum graminicola]